MTPPLTRPQWSLINKKSPGSARPGATGGSPAPSLSRVIAQAAAAGRWRASSQVIHPARPWGVGPLIRQRHLQVVGLPVQMSVNLAYHRAIPMSHQFRDGQMIVALHEFPGREAVPGVIHGHLPTCRA